MRDELLEFLKMNDVKYKENAIMKDMSPIRIGAEADFAVYPNSESDFIGILRFLETSKIPYKILGRMSNVLPTDEKYHRVIVKTDYLNSFSKDGDGITAYSGASLPFICSCAADLGLSGMERLSGIPGSIGGALIGNAGAFGQEISDVIEFVKVLDLKCGKSLILSNNDIKFAYRYSNIAENGFALIFAKFKLTNSDSEKIRADIAECKRKRLDSQPIGEPSLGSVFKRPGGNIFAARLIDQCGLRGYSIGGAVVSNKHAGFIVNGGHATASDYKSLCEYIKKCVFDKFSVNLETEVEFL